jgi:methionyl-tRNA formyltransferase
MFDTIILLTGPVEQAVLASALLGHNPKLTVHWVASPDDFTRFDMDALARSRLVAFATPVIVPPGVLDALGYGAYNFHPGPPEYPGWAPAHFALYEQAIEFGATAHAMAARVDSGPIVEAVHFPIPADIGVLGLEGLAYAHLAQLFWRLARYLRPKPSRCRHVRCNGECGDIRAAPIGLSATSRSTSARKSSIAACACSAAITGACRRPSSCTASSSAPWWLNLRRAPAISRLIGVPAAADSGFATAESRASVSASA